MRLMFFKADFKSFCREISGNEKGSLKKWIKTDNDGHDHNNSYLIVLCSMKDIIKKS